MREWTGALAIVVMMAGCQVQLGSREDGTAGGSGSSGGAGLKHPLIFRAVCKLV
jgi:hypothetical protein